MAEINYGLGICMCKVKEGMSQIEALAYLHNNYKQFRISLHRSTLSEALNNLKPVNMVMAKTFTPYFGFLFDVRPYQELARSSYWGVPPAYAMDINRLDVWMHIAKRMTLNEHYVKIRLAGEWLKWDYEVLPMSLDDAVAHVMNFGNLGWFKHSVEEAERHHSGIFEVYKRALAETQPVPDSECMPIVNLNYS